MNRPALHATGLGRSFGSRRIINGLSLSISPGEFVVLTGKNGAGKSTLLRMFAGLLRPDRGTVDVFGVPPEKLRRSSEFYLAFQSPESFLYGELTVRENLELVRNCLLFRKTKVAAETEVKATAEVLAMCDLDRFSSRKLREASQGIVQRASLARLLFQRPDLLLLDEPFSHLDQHSIELLIRQLRELREKGSTICAVLHEEVLVREFSPRRFELENGALREL